MREALEPVHDEGVIVTCCAVVTSCEEIAADVAVGEPSSSGRFDEDHIGNSIASVRISPEGLAVGVDEKGAEFLSESIRD